MEKNRVGLPRVGSPQQNHVGIFNFAIRTAAASCSEYRRQTGDAGGVSSTVAAINIVGAHYTTGEFLRGVVDLVDGLGTAEHAKVAAVVLGDGFLEGRSHAVQGFI